MAASLGSMRALSTVASNRAAFSESASTSRPTVRNAPVVSRQSQGRTQQSRVVAYYQKFDTVADVMTSGHIYSCKPDDTVDSALESLVQFKITGLPVVDDHNVVVGVVSDFDLLALDTLGRTNDEELFPEADTTWQAFKEVKAFIGKSAGKKIRDVMTITPIVISPETGINEATRILLNKKIRRLPVVDTNGKLVGLLSRGNIVKAALAARKASKAAKAAAAAASPSQ